MIHNNFTPKGRIVPTYPGAIVPNHSYQVTAEWAYGVKPWFEQGLYLPVSSPYSTNHGSTINGFKIRELASTWRRYFFLSTEFQRSMGNQLTALD
jgi:hypothetical protein